MKNFDKRRICVVGAGNWGQNHIKTLYSLDCPFGVVDNNKGALESVKRNILIVAFFSMLMMLSMQVLMVI